MDLPLFKDFDSISVVVDSCHIVNHYNVQNHNIEAKKEFYGLFHSFIYLLG